VGADDVVRLRRDLLGVAGRRGPRRVGSRQPLLVVADGLEDRAQEGAQAQPELGLLGLHARAFTADALTLGVGLVDEIAALGLGLPHDQLGLA